MAREDIAYVLIVIVIVMVLLVAMVILLSQAFRNEYPDYVIKKDVPCYDKYSNKIQDTTCVEKIPCGKGFKSWTNEVECKE